MDAREILAWIFTFSAPFVVIYQIYLHKMGTANKERSNELQNAINLVRQSVESKCDPERVRDLIDKEITGLQHSQDTTIKRTAELSKEVSELNYRVGAHLQRDYK
jgi:hypothetical protein